MPPFLSDLMDQWRRLSARKRVTITGFVVVVAMIALALNAPIYTQSQPESNPQATRGFTSKLEKFVTHTAPKELPAIGFTRVTETGTEMTDFGAYRGQILLVNFWATWCAPCRKEMPQFDALQAHFAGQPVTVLALSLDRGDIEKPMNFLDSLAISHLARGHDAGGASGRAVGLFGLPTTLLIDREGREIGRLQGIAEWDSDAAKDLIAQALAHF